MRPRPPRQGPQRRRLAGRPDELYDRLETQRRVAANYRAVMAELAAGERIVTLDGTLPADELAARILHLCREVMV